MRNIKTQALLLHAKPQGDYHKLITAVSPDLGIFYATAYGAYKSKSKMVSSAEPFHHVRVYLYNNPVKERYKVTDIEIVDAYGEIRNDVEKIMAAGLVGEILSKSHRDLNAANVFGLSLAFFSLLNDSPIQAVDFLLFQFIFRYLMFAGVFAIPENCDHCRKRLDNTDAVYWTGIEGEYMCGECNHSGDMELPVSVIKYLSKTLGMTIEKACCITTDDKLRSSLKRFALALTSESLGCKLGTPWM